MKSNKSQMVASNRFTYQVLRAPVITEKSTSATSLKRYTFEVHPDATKCDIAAAVGALFKVEVDKVAVSNKRGKSRRFRGKPGVTASVRKAVVKLKAGSIDFGGKI